MPTELARNALTCAEQFLEWMDTNKEESKAIASSLVSNLRGCFHKSKSTRVARDRMWEKFYKFRSSDGYKKFWKEILSDSISHKACPIFYQYVTDKVMESLITFQFPLGLEASQESPMELDYEEMSALRYTVGSVMRSLQTKVKKSAHPLKSELALCLTELLDDSGRVIAIYNGLFNSKGCDSRAHISEQWTDLVDRGGLIHVSDTLYSLFVSMEMELRSHLHTGNPGLVRGMKEQMCTSVAENEDVLFYWSTISANWLEEEAQELLTLMVKHWVTTRGFSFVSSFMEKYKCKHKKTIEKSKGLRKNLIGMS